MILEYVSLFILIASVIIVIYIALYIHDIPYQIATKRNHPQAEAIHVGCWLSLFTLHVLWPIVFIWAVSNTKQPSAGGEEQSASGEQSVVAELRETIKQLQSQVNELSESIDGKKA